MEFYKKELARAEQEALMNKEQAMRFQKLALDNEAKITELTVKLLEEQSNSGKKKKKN